MKIQALVDALGAQAQEERATYQMTLGELVSRLSSLPQDAKVEGMSSEAISYRGYYSEIAFLHGSSTVGEILETAKDSIGRTYQGYKGGDFVMQKNTPVWVSDYGTSSGLQIMSIQKDGVDYLVHCQPEE
jgi:hypothetical protein